MDFDHIHFYVHDAQQCRDWFLQVLGFQHLDTVTTESEQIELLQVGQIVCAFSSPLHPTSPVATYLQFHPPGVFDLAFRVQDAQSALVRAEHQGAVIVQPLTIEQQGSGTIKWGKVKGWGALQHTLVERLGSVSALPLGQNQSMVQWQADPLGKRGPFTHIDHAVLNVSENELRMAVNWYQRVFGLEPRRYFDIQTPRSGLRSEVLTHSQGQVKFPINEPTSANSQIQEFLDINRGPGIQHIALGTANIVETVAQLRARGLSLLDIPQSYYQQLRDQFEQQYSHLNWPAIENQNILVDVEGKFGSGILLQTFTQPIFQQPTFFFEIIERQRQAQGFGQRNFLALFQAMEREQLKRSVLS